MANYDRCTPNNSLVVTGNNTLQQVVYTDWDHVFITVFIPAITVFGLLSNGSFLFVLYRIPRMRTIPNFYLANLAIADISILLVVLIRNISVYIANILQDDPDVITWGSQGSLPWNHPIACYLPKFISRSVMACSVFLVTLVSVERYFAVCHPLQHRLVNSRSRAARIILVVWMISFGTAAVAISPSEMSHKCFHYDVTAKPIVVFECVNLCDICKTVGIALDTAQFYTAVVISSIMYGFIIAKVYRREEVDRSIVHGGSSTEIRNAVARLVIINSMLFFVCLLPYSIVEIQAISLQLGGDYFLSTKTFDKFAWIGRVCTLINSVINPVVYNLANKRYRRAFYEAFVAKM